MNGRQFMYIPPQFERDEAAADLMVSPRRFEHAEAAYPMNVFERDEAPADLMDSPRRQYMPHRVFEHDEAHADRMYSPRPQRLRTSRQEAARQRKNTRRAIRRAQRINSGNIFLRPYNPGNIFLNQIQQMPIPAPPVGPRRQLCDPNSKRSRRRHIADGWVFVGGKTRRHRRRY